MTQSQQDSVEQALVPIKQAVEDFRTWHDPDDLYMALQEKIAEAAAKLQQLMVEARIDELEHVAVINGELGMEYIGERPRGAQYLTMDERITELQAQFTAKEKP